MLTFANNFLHGASEGRLRQFQMSEQAKKEHERNYDATVQHIQDSPNYTREFKEQTMQDALAAKAGAAQAVLGKPGKSDHPLKSLASGIFTSIVGPAGNPNHVDIGPDHVSDLITKMHDPTNQFDLPSTLTNARSQLADVIKSKTDAAARTGAQINQRDLINDPDIIKTLAPLQRQGYDSSGLLSQALAGVAPVLPPVQQAQLAAAKARQTMYEGRQNQPVTFVKKNGEQFSATLGADKKYYYPGTTTPVPEGDMIGASMANMAPMVTTGTRLTTDANGNIIELPTQTIRGRGAVPATTPPPPTTPAAGTEPPPVAAPGATNQTPAPAALQIPEFAPGQPNRQQLAFLNNNPGNLEFRGQPGAVMGDDGRFAKFTKPEDGYNALVSQIQLDQSRPDMTLGSYISKFAPPGGRDKNDTGGYVKDASKALGVDAATPLAQVDPHRLAQFQAQEESGSKVAGATATQPPPAAGGPKIVGHKPSTSAAPLTDEQIRQKAADDPSLDFDAWTYMLEKKFNVRGIGKGATEGAEQIKKRAGQIMKDFDLNPAELFSRGADLKASVPALTKVTTNAALIEGFEGTLQKNAEVAKKLSEAYSRGNFPLINNVVNAFKTGTGDSEALNLAGQLHVMSREWAKIMAGAVSSNGVPIREAEQTDALIAKGISDGQLNSLIDNVIIPDARNRTSANNEEKQKLRDSIAALTGKGGKGSTPPPPNAAPPPMPGRPTQADIGKVFLSPTKGRVKLLAVDPANPDHVMTQAVQ